MLAKFKAIRLRERARDETVLADMDFRLGKGVLCGKWTAWKVRVVQTNGSEGFGNCFMPRLN